MPTVPYGSDFSLPQKEVLWSYQGHALLYTTGSEAGKEEEPPAERLILTHSPSEAVFLNCMSE